ncbi:MAG: hypothetical protein L0154_01975 [Chloroflexi bacterium]|nr:hypothetical protein [Chloroflexota bacterium]
MRDNPHLRRLGKRPRRFVYDVTTGFVLLWLVINLMIVTYGVLQLRGTLKLFMAAGGVMVLYSLIVGPFMAWFTAHDVSRTNYELLRITMLSRRDLVGGYIWGGLRRFHYETGLPAFAIPPMIIITDGIILLSASTRFRYAVIDIPIEREVFAFMAVLSLVGMSLLSITSGVALGLWLRSGLLAFAASLVVQLVFLGVWYVVVLQLSYGALIAVPLVLAGVGLILAYRLAD